MKNGTPPILCLIGFFIILFPSKVSTFEVKWTPEDAEGPLPLSQKYRDKLKLLEEKVGSEKFRELTGLTPPSMAPPFLGMENRRLLDPLQRLLLATSTSIFTFCRNKKLNSSSIKIFVVLIAFFISTKLVWESSINNHGNGVGLPSLVLNQWHLNHILPIKPSVPTKFIQNNSRDGNGGEYHISLFKPSQTFVSTWLHSKVNKGKHVDTIILKPRHGREKVLEKVKSKQDDQKEGKRTAGDDDLKQVLNISYSQFTPCLSLNILNDDIEDIDLNMLLRTFNHKLRSVVLDDEHQVIKVDSDHLAVMFKHGLFWYTVAYQLETCRKRKQEPVLLRFSPLSSSSSGGHAPLFPEISVSFAISSSSSRSQTNNIEVYQGESCIKSKNHHNKLDVVLSVEEFCLLESSLCEKGLLYTVGAYLAKIFKEEISLQNERNINSQRYEASAQQSLADLRNFKRKMKLGRSDAKVKVRFRGGVLLTANRKWAMKR